MYRTLAVRASIVGALIICAAIACGAVSVARAQSQCPAGTQAATASDLSTMVSAGISNPQVGQCWNPGSAVLGTQAAAAKASLKNFLCTSAAAKANNYGGMGPDGTIDNLNPAFAICANNFLTAEKQKMPEVCIYEGVRSQQRQQQYYNNYVNGTGGIACNPSTASCEHPRGVAIDVNVNTQAEYNQLHADAGGYGLDFYLPTSDKVHFVPTVEVNNPNASGPCMTSGYTPSGTNVPTTPGAGIVAAGQNFLGQQPNITSTPGLGSTPQPGQVLSQDTTCLISTNPVYYITVPAGTPYPSNCISSQTTGPTQSYCAGNTIMYYSSGNTTVGQVCPSGCSNGTCTQTQCATGYTLSNGVCTPQQCPSGSTMSNGVCMQTQQQASQPSSAASSPASSASTPASNGSTQSTAGTAASSPAGITSPTLVPNLGGTSTLAILQELANPSPAPTTRSTTTSIALNAGDSDIAQLQAQAPPGVTYADPASAFYPQSGSNNSNTNENSNTITTTAGTGYDITSGPAYASGTIATTQAPSSPGSADTFAQSGTVGGSNEFNAPSTFESGPLAVLATLKAEVLGAMGFLAIYTRPFGGAVPSQMGGD